MNIMEVEMRRDYEERHRKFGSPLEVEINWIMESVMRMGIEAITYFERNSGNFSMDEISVNKWQHYWKTEVPVVLEQYSSGFSDLMLVELSNDGGVAGCGRMFFHKMAYLYLSTIVIPPLRDLFNMDFSSCQGGIPVALKHIRIQYYKALLCLPLLSEKRESLGCLARPQDTRLWRLYLGEAESHGMACTDELLAQTSTYVFDITPLSVTPDKPEVLVLSQSHDFLKGPVHLGPEHRCELFYYMAALAKRTCTEHGIGGLDSLNNMTKEPMLTYSPVRTDANDNALTEAYLSSSDFSQDSTKTTRYEVQVSEF